jgi:hypothetical protein
VPDSTVRPFITLAVIDISKYFVISSQSLIDRTETSGVANDLQTVNSMVFARRVSIQVSLSLWRIDIDTAIDTVIDIEI